MVHSEFTISTCLTDEILRLKDSYAIYEQNLLNN